MKHTTFITLLILVGLTACETIDRPTANDRSFGSVDPTVFVTVGNSLTAGYQSGALFETAQQYSIPAQLARHFGVDMVQPLFAEPGTGQRITLNALTTSGADLVRGDVIQAPPTNVAHPAPYHNLGLPGAILYDFMDESDALAKSQQRGNPFFYGILRNQAALGASVLEQAVTLNPTFMTFWFGTNDVLGYAASGGTTGTNQTQDGPTEPQIFEMLMTQALQTLSMRLPDTKVLVANVPNILRSPYFVSHVKSVTHPQNPDIQLPIWFRHSAGQVTSIGEEDYLLLPALSALEMGIGLSPENPLGSEFVLDVSEATKSLNAISAYNVAIFKLVEGSALRENFRLVDMNALFEDIYANGVHFAGESYSTKFITGGLFSLDGLHLMPRGNAIVANEFIKAMNQEFGANLPLLLLHDLPGVDAPKSAPAKRALSPLSVRSGPGMFNGALLRF